MTKPTKMRNRQIYKASQALRSSQVSANLSKGLRSKYGKRSIRIVEGDSVTILRGEYADVSGKIEKVDIASGRVSVSGIKKEKAKGDKFDVMIHASNLRVSGLNLGDPLRRSKIGATDEHEAEGVYDEPAAGSSGVATGAAAGAAGAAAVATEAGTASTTTTTTPTTADAAEPDDAGGAESARDDADLGGEDEDDSGVDESGGEGGNDSAPADSPDAETREAGDSVQADKTEPNGPGSGS